MTALRNTIVILLSLSNVTICQERLSGLSRELAYQRAERLSALGRRLFFDTALSKSGKLSCTSCHDPSKAFGPPNDLSVQPGGTRAVPSLRYLQVTPPFTEHYFDSDENGDDSIDKGPTGGLTWDGRVDRGRDQARIPLLSVNEMANDNPARVVASARKADYATELAELSGFKSTDRTFETILEALETYQQDYRAFYPYSSKYDAWLQGKTQLTAQEARGLSLFNRPDKGNCAVCHLSARGANGTPPQFTDYGLIALGVPRNKTIPANQDPSYFDLGLCGPIRTDLQKTEYCGLFMTPSLRNVAMRGSFFHNGVFHTLKQVLEFYVQRDTQPEKWYPLGHEGKVEKFDDLPAAYRSNVNSDPPFGGRPGEKPALTDEEIQDVIAFLQTLTDGFIAPK